MTRIPSRALSFACRIGELGCGTVVLAIMARWLHLPENRDKAISSVDNRYIYALSVAAASDLYALLFLLPFDMSFMYFPVDFLFCCAWFTFALMLGYFHHQSTCKQDLAEGIQMLTVGGKCSQVRASWAFGFLTGVFYLLSALVGGWFSSREKPWRTKKGKSEAIVVPIDR